MKKQSRLLKFFLYVLCEIIYFGIPKSKLEGQKTLKAVSKQIFSVHQFVTPGSLEQCQSYISPAVNKHFSIDLEWLK